MNRLERFFTGLGKCIAYLFLCVTAMFLIEYEFNFNNTAIEYLINWVALFIGYLGMKIFIGWVKE